MKNGGGGGNWTQPNVAPNNRKPATSVTLQLHSFLVNAPKRTDTHESCAIFVPVAPPGGGGIQLQAPLLFYMG